MEKEYINCKNGLTPQCPYFDDPIMTKLLAKQTVNNTVNYFSAKDINEANSLCKKCDSFIPVQDE